MQDTILIQQLIYESVQERKRAVLTKTIFYKLEINHHQSREWHESVSVIFYNVKQLFSLRGIFLKMSTQWIDFEDSFTIHHPRTMTEIDQDNVTGCFPYILFDDIREINDAFKVEEIEFDVLSISISI